MLRFRTPLSRGQGQPKAGGATLDAGGRVRRRRPAWEVAPDRQGRVPVPTHLRDFAGLALDREVVVAGVLSRIEIWDGQRWAQREQEGEQFISDAVGIPDFGI